MTVTVYTTPGCPGCNLTKRQLVKRGHDVDERPLDALEDTMRQRFSTAPVVDTGADQWDGYRPDRIDALEV